MIPWRTDRFFHQTASKVNIGLKISTTHPLLWTFRGGHFDKWRIWSCLRIIAENLTAQRFFKEWQVNFLAWNKYFPLEKLLKVTRPNQYLGAAVEDCTAKFSTFTWHAYCSHDWLVNRFKLKNTFGISAFHSHPGLFSPWLWLCLLCWVPPP